VPVGRGEQQEVAGGVGVQVPPIPAAGKRRDEIERRRGEEEMETREGNKMRTGRAGDLGTGDDAAGEGEKDRWGEIARMPVHLKVRGKGRRGGLITGEGHEME
jgi:hypothetical protein